MPGGSSPLSWGHCRSLRSRLSGVGRDRYPQYAIGHLERMKQLEEKVQALPRLQLIGNAYYSVGLPDMVRQGREAARKLMGRSPLPLI